MINKLKGKIEKLKKEKNAVILAHNYQRGKLQDIADFVGDSFGLSRRASETEADIILFLGVRCMAETASILNPDKKVLLPDRYASCKLAEMCPIEKLNSEKDDHPDAAVVSYVNASADVKAESDICCTSSNAVNIVKTLPNEEVLFVPDRNLGSFVKRRTPNKKIILWPGYCYVHQDIDLNKINNFKQTYPDAAVMVHPECIIKVRESADFIGSTAQMQKYVRDTGKEKYIVGTEDGLTYRLRRDNPDKTFYSVGATCVGMKRNTLHDVLFSLEKEKYEVRISEETRIRAEKALNKMLEVKM